jgi:hypothetical protein
VTSSFREALLALLVLGVLGSVVAVVRARRASSGHRVRAGARILTGSAVLGVVLATAMPRSWPPVWQTDGDLVLTPGRDTLGRLGQIFSSGGIEDLLVLGNVAIYVPLGFFMTVAGARPFRAMFAAGALSAAVESLQMLGLGRVASIDDWLLNIIGAALGVATAKAMTSRSTGGDQLG